MRGLMPSLSVALMSLLAGCITAGTALGEGKPEQYPTGFDCRTLPATDRATCQKTQIETPEAEPPAPAPRTGVPQPIYPGGKLPLPAQPAPRGN